MKHILDFFDRLAENNERRQRERIEAYLANATDLYDLDARLCELDREYKRVPAIGAW
jgi:hypothetical protein